MGKLSEPIGLEEHLYNLAFPEGNDNSSSQEKLLYSLWVAHRETLRLQLTATSQMFLAFSDHGPNHSQSIVDIIGKLLGERVKCLSATDTWMLLECAYRHDVGMFVTYNEVREFILSDDYRDQLFRLRDSEDEQLRRAALSLISPAFPNERAELDRIALTILEKAKDQGIVNQEYFRPRHSERSSNSITQNIASILPSSVDSLIPNRLWKLMAKICLAHTLDREFLLGDFTDFGESNGFCNDYVHPRFLMFLLRLGDVLDMDNNRFNRFQLELWGNDLTEQNLAHLEKHSSMWQILVRQESIELIARLDEQDVSSAPPKGKFFDDEKAAYRKKTNELAQSWGVNGDSVEYVISKILETRWHEQKYTLDRQKSARRANELLKQLNNACDVVNGWFKQVKDDLEFIAVHWLEIAPKDFPGTIARLSKAEIWLKGRKLDPNIIGLRYEFSHRRAASIILGTDLYGISKDADSRYSIASNELMFMREFIQNAMDATCVQVYRYLLQTCYGMPCDDFGPELYQSDMHMDIKTKFVNEFTQWDPVSVFRSIGSHINRLIVELRVRIYSTHSNNRLILVFRDYGTGIDAETLQYMKSIGSTRSKTLTNEIADMPEWLRPNGSFGIGMQSVFGVVDEIFAESGSRNDHKVRNLYFCSAKNGGKIFAVEQRDHAERTNTYGSKFSVLLSDEQLEKTGLLGDGREYFNRDCASILRRLNAQIEQIVGNHLFQLSVRYFIDDVEVVKSSHMYEPVFSYLTLKPNERPSAFSAQSHFEELLYYVDRLGNYTRVVLTNEELRPGKQKITSNTNHLYIICYNNNAKMLIFMRLFELEEGDATAVSTIYEEGINTLRPIEFFYRGLRVPGVHDTISFVYPCWEINAYGYFGNAADYLEISRSDLLSNVKDGVYRSICECADYTLGEFWSHLTQFEDKLVLSSGQNDSIALSYVFQLIATRSGRLPFDMTTEDLRRWMMSSDGRIMTMRVVEESDTLFTLRRVPVMMRDIFLDIYGDIHLDNIWFLPKEQMIEGRACGADVNTTFVEDIFTEYFVNRGIVIRASNMEVYPWSSFINPPFPGFLVTYTLEIDQQLLPVGWTLDERVKANWFLLMSLAKNLGMDTGTLCGDDFVVLPGFSGFNEKLVIEKLPIKFYPKGMKALGRYILTPIKYRDFYEWIDAIDNYERERVVDRIKGAIHTATKTDANWLRSNDRGDIINYVRTQNNLSENVEDVGRMYMDFVEVLFGVIGLE